MLQNIKKRDPLELFLKITIKVLQCRKNRKGDSLISSGSVGYIKGKDEGGPFAPSFRWPDSVVV